MAKKLLMLVVCLFIGVSTIVLIQKDAGSGASNQSKDNATETTETSSKTVALPGKYEDWNLVLVNQDHPINEEPTNLVDIGDGKLIDERVLPHYNDLAKAAEKANIELVVVSSFRSVSEQEAIVERDTNHYINQGYAKDEARKEAMGYLTEPGLSEHHTGMALDVLEANWYNDGNMLEPEFGETKAGKWLEENVCHYGFVIRYERGKEQLTGINYEPWHIRYVGKENAEYMIAHNLSLEEYVEQLKSR